MEKQDSEDLAEHLGGGWNYRLVLMDESSPDEPWYEVHEVFYDKEGKPLLWTQEAIKASGESPQAVMHDLLLMAIDANRHPALKESELPKSPNDNPTNNPGDEQ